MPSAATRHSLNRTVSRVLVIGLDGATFDVLGPLVAAGVMPNMARLMQTSALAELNSTRPFVTPVAWSTFQTGCDPQQHGIWDYRHFDHASQRLQLNHAGRLQRPTLFDAVWKAGGEVVSLNLPMTFPPRAQARGLTIGGIDAPSIAAALAPYPEFAQRVRAAGISFELRTIWKRRPATFDELSAGIDQTVADFHGRAQAARIADTLADWRLMVVQFQTLDCLQHRCWEWLIPGNEQHAAALSSWVAEVRRAMAALDRAVGELCELADKRQAAVVAVSDHGFGAFREKINVLELLRERGLLSMQTAARRGRYLAAQVAWKLRRWSASRKPSGPATASLSRSLAALAPIDWRRSRAVALHGDLAGMVYLNHDGRFAGSGPQSSSMREQTLCEVTAAFHEVAHPETSERLFDEVIDVRTAFDCDPVERQCPDVIAIPAAGFHTRTKPDPAGQLLRSDAAMTGTHRPLGVLMLNAPGAVLGQHAVAELRDVAPTILRLLGIVPVQPMTGRALDHLLSSDACDTAVEESASALHNDESAVYTESETAAVESRLKDLGYLD